jgi:esterase/lipase
MENIINPTNSPVFYSNIDKLSEPNKVKYIVITCAGAGGGPGKNGCYGPNNLYVNLFNNLIQYNIGVVAIEYRFAGKSDEAIKDAIFVVEKVINEFNCPIVMIGWSMGSKVTIQTAKFINNKYNASNNRIIGLITVAGQTKGTNEIEEINDIKMLILHGTRDLCLNVNNAIILYERAYHLNPQLKLYQFADHDIADPDCEKDITNFLLSIDALF